MNIHKIAKFIVTECSTDDVYLIEDLCHIVRSARSDFENVGVPFTQEGFIHYFKKTHMTNPTPYPPYVNILKAIEGDNLDAIEDAAEKKGLI